MALLLAALASATVLGVSSLLFTNATLKRVAAQDEAEAAREAEAEKRAAEASKDPAIAEKVRLEKKEARERSFAERRRIIQERRKVFAECYALPGLNKESRSANWRGMVEADKELTELAKEEAGP